jgi:hypothetical protein
MGTAAQPQKGATTNVSTGLDSRVSLAIQTNNAATRQSASDAGQSLIRPEKSLLPKKIEFS